MDSGNSGSMQSSSGGDDQEYDSRATDSISPLFNPSLTFASLSNHPQPPPPQPPPPLSHHHNHTHPPPPPTFFDHPHHQQPHNLDLVWSRSGVLGSGSEPNYSNLGNLGGLPSFPPSATQPQLGLNQGPDHGPSHSADGNGGRGPPNNSVSDQNPTSNVGKNSRKRTRASRRAPTTVLTTDTTNFRQMVQEFTGIPAPPFSSGASPYSRRLDLFSSGGRSSHLETLGPLYPFRPSKVNQVQPSQPPPPFVSSSMLNSSMIDAANGGSSGGNNENYHQLMNIQNPMLTFQSLLQSSHPLKYNPLVNGPGFASKAQGNSGIGYNELGVNQEHGDLNLSGFSAQLGSNSSDLSRWRGDQEAAAAAAADQRLGSFDGGPTQNVGYKMNCSASTSERRNEGTVDSWICPSD